MESWAASISDRMARIEKSLQTIHAECRLLRGELTGAVRDNEDCDGIVEEKTTREIVEKIAWDVEKIKDKICLNNFPEEIAAHPEQVDGDPTSEVISGESELESEGEDTEDLHSDITGQLEEEILKLEHLSLPGPPIKTDEEESKRLVRECQEIFRAQSITTVHDKYKSAENVPYVFIRLQNYSSRALLNTEVTVHGGTHTFEYSQPIESGQRIQFTIHPNYNPGEVLFAVSTSMDGTNEKLCVVGHCIYPQAFANVAIVRQSIQIPSSYDELAAFKNELSSQDDSRSDGIQYRPVPISSTFNEDVISSRCMASFIRMRVAPTRESFQGVFNWISILDKPEPPSFVNASLCRDLNTPFTFPNLQTVSISKLSAPSLYKTGSVPCRRSCIVDLTNLSGTTLSNLQEKFTSLKIKSDTPIFIDPIKPMSRIFALLPAAKESPNYISYQLEGTDLGLMVYWNMHEHSNSFALALVPENLVMDSKLKKSMLLPDEFGHRPDRDVANVVDEPQAFTINCRNVFAWASLTRGRNARLKIVVYTV